MKKGLTLLLSGLLTVASASAATYTWNGGPTGIWDTSTLNWTNPGAAAWPTTNPSTTTASIGLVSIEALTIANNTTIYANGAHIGNGSALYSGNSFSKLVFTGTTSTLDLGGSAIYWNANTEVASGTALNITSGSLYLGRRAVDGSAINSNFNASGQKVTSSVNILLVGVRTQGTGDVAANATFGATSDSTLSVSAGSGIGVLGAVNPYIGNLSGTLNLVGGINTITTANGADPALRVGRVFGDNTTNTAAVSGILNISGGTTTISHSGTSNVNAIILAERDANANVNTTVTGLLSLTGGTLNLSGDDIYGGGGTSTVTLNGGILDLGGGNLGRSGGLITNLNFQSGTLQNVGQINNGAGLTKTTAGTLTLAGTNTYTGLTTVSAGTLAYGVNNAIYTGAVTVNGATAVLSLGAFNDTVGTVTVAGGGSITGSGTLTSTGTFEMQSGSVSAILAGSGIALNKTTSGTVALTGANTYSGTTTLSDGVLQAGNNAAFGTGALALNGGTLSSNSGTARAFNNAVTLGGNVTLGNGTQNGVLTFNGAGTLTGNRTITTESNVTYAGAVGGGAFGLTKAGASTLTLTAANTYTGGTTVNVGTLALSGAGSLADGGAVIVSGGTLDLGGISDTVGAVTLSSGTISNGILTGTSYSATNTGTVSAVLAGSGAFTKTGSGAVTFSAANTYTGATIVSAGSLVLSSTGSVASSLIQVQTTATLDGSAVSGGFQLKSGQTLQNSGTFTGNLTALTGSKYAPGNSPGTATQAGDLTLNTGSTFEWELVANSSTGAGTNFDQTVFSPGALTIQSGVTADLVFDFTGSTVLWADAFWSSNQQWLVFSGASSLTNVAGIFTTITVGMDSAGNTLAPSQGSFGFTNVGSDVYLTYSIPEPSTTLLLTGALTALVIFRRRRA